MRFGSLLTLPLPDAEASEFPQGVESYVLRLRRHYDFRAIWHRRFYRASGILVIVVGAALPLLVSLDYAAKSVVVSVSGVLIAAVTALRTFYRWDQSWMALRNAETAITRVWWDYQGKVGQDGADRSALALELVRQVFEIRRAEAESYFDELAFPAGRGVDGAFGQR